MDDRKDGVVVRWTPDRGYGFIESGGDTYFFHRTFMSPSSRFEDARPGQEVLFRPHKSSKGLDAFDVHLEKARAVLEVTVEPGIGRAPTPAMGLEQSASRAPTSLGETSGIVRRYLEALGPGEEVSVDEVVNRSGEARSAVIREMQRWGQSGRGRFVVGRRGALSRFRRRDPDFGQVA